MDQQQPGPPDGHAEQRPDTEQRRDTERPADTERFADTERLTATERPADTERLADTAAPQPFPAPQPYPAPQPFSTAQDPTTPQPSSAPPGAAGPPVPSAPPAGYPAAPAGFPTPPGAPTSDYPGSPTSGFPGSPTSGHPGSPTSGQPGAFGPSPLGPGGVPAPAGPPPRRRRVGLIAAIVVGVTLLLCAVGGTGAYFVVTRLDGKGQATPKQAVDAFLQAVFEEHDAKKASDLVCREARDEAALKKRINDLKKYDEKYNSPDYDWLATLDGDGRKNTANVHVMLRVLTEDDRSVRRALDFTTIRRNGWWVCEIRDEKEAK